MTSAFKAGAISLATSYATSAVGANFDAGTWQNVLGNALVGGVSSELQGGNFGHGFWAAGLTAAAKGADGDFGLGTSEDMKPMRVLAAITGSG